MMRKERKKRGGESKGFLVFWMRGDAVRMGAMGKGILLYLLPT